MTTDSSQLPNDFIKDEKKKGNGRIRIVLLLVAAIATGYWVYRGQEEVRQPIPPVRPTQPVQPTQPAQPEIRSEIAPIVRTPETEAGTDTEEKAKAVTETTAVETPLPSTEADNPATVIPLPTPTPSVATQAENLPEGEAARVLIRAARATGDAIDFANLYQQAEQFQQQERHTDAFLLYFFSAREGHDRSALKLAEMNDPAHFTGEGGLLESADPMQAYKWYKLAAEGGLNEARVRLALLRKATETAAAAGDPKAQRLLLNWK